MIYWSIFGVFLYKGSMGGTSIFLIFLSAPVGFYFFNMFWGLIFGLGMCVGMAIYMWTPLHLSGYAFPEIYNIRLPYMYFVEVIVCALAQYEIIKAQTKLQQAALEAESANRAKSDFLSNMSHEIRTPINAVLGMNEMIMRESCQPDTTIMQGEERVKEVFKEVSKYSRDIESAGNSLLSIVNDILDFSKIEAGRLEIVNNDYKLSSVLNDVSNMIYFKAKAKNLGFFIEVDENIPDTLCGDELRIRQVMLNLLGNAVKYTREGSARLIVKQERLKDNRINLVISVRDTGIGIKENDIPKLFNKFQRVDLEKNSTVEGTGLGLAITKNLVDMMGGNISVESVYGLGSNFTVKIPQTYTYAESIGDFRAKFEKNMEKRSSYRESFKAPDARILVVDDTQVNLVVVSGLLKNTEIKIDTALSGPDAIEKAIDEKYDVILMDQRMPGMDGTEAMNRIKNEQGGVNSKTPFICLTADAISGARERYLSEGFVDYLTKPMDYRVLEAMLIRYLPETKVKKLR
jgi:signal transduction histidine kinase/ActR/RegA family two-component response regulator